MRICVYGASSNSIDSKYIEAGKELGRQMALEGHTLIFGGGATGMMGAVADGMKEHDGDIIGIAPKFFDRPGVLVKSFKEFYFTETMRDRKELMEDKSDAFIMTPGGIGTMEEFFEIFTLRQLGRHEKPIGILNIDGYYDELLMMLKHTAEQGFMTDDCLNMLKVASSPRKLLSQFE